MPTFHLPAGQTVEALWSKVQCMSFTDLHQFTLPFAIESFVQCCVILQASAGYYVETKPIRRLGKYEHKFRAKTN